MGEKIPEEKKIELCHLVCAEIAIGSSVEKACEKVGIGFRIFYEMIRESLEIEQDYARAREARADVRFDRTDKLLEEIYDGKVRPDIARVLLDGIKWMTGKEKPKKYGDNQQINHTGNIQVEQLIIQRTPKTIEHQPEIKALPIIDADVK